MLVFVRRGYFRRSSELGDELLDPTLAYFTNPGEEQRVDHPHSHGDECTAVSLDPTLVAEIWGGDPELPSKPVMVEPSLDVEQRLLVASPDEGEDPHERVERTIALFARALESADSRRVQAGRPATATQRRVLVDSAREALADQPGTPLPALARELAVSPHHLSRIFRASTGRTISRHRMRLRARAALERLAGGEPDLARLAADLGFADQSHLSRVLRSETGRPPSVLRQLLSDG
jgi:AraC-like DNA-binding protein